MPEGTLGDRLRQRRWNRGLEQRDAAAEIGVSVATYRNWEVNRFIPTVKHLPATIAFLGYDWRESDGTPGGRLRLARAARGLTIRRLSEDL